MNDRARADMVYVGGDVSLYEKEEDLLERDREKGWAEDGRGGIGPDLRGNQGRCRDRHRVQREDLRQRRLGNGSMYFVSDEVRVPRDRRLGDAGSTHDTGS